MNLDLYLKKKMKMKMKWRSSLPFWCERADESFLLPRFLILQFTLFSCFLYDLKDLGPNALFYVMGLAHTLAYSIFNPTQPNPTSNGTIKCQANKQTHFNIHINMLLNYYTFISLWISVSKVFLFYHFNICNKLRERLVHYNVMLDFLNLDPWNHIMEI
jgi:hypothetical protein